VLRVTSSLFKVCEVYLLWVMDVTRQVLVNMLEEFRRDTHWLEGHYEELKKSYPEEYVAVYEEKVVDHDPDLDRLMARLEGSYPGKSGKLAIEYVTTRKIEMVLCA